MSEFWKSTPRYWCKYCSMYVRDTKLERANHEATGKHRGGVERALRDLHRGHEKQEREKERARREIDRLNGVVSGGDDRGRGGRAGPPQGAAAGSSSSNSREQQQAQLEQLAGMGVNIPDELRSQMAMAGEWTITKTRVVDDGEGNEGVARGVRKRELDKTEEEKEEETALNRLFKKPRRWGADSRLATEDDGGDLDALLSGSSFVVKREKEEEDGDEEETKDSKVKVGHTAEASKSVASSLDVTADPVKEEETGVKKEPEDDVSGPPAAIEPAAPAVVFKKRKPKNIRQK